MSGLFVAVVGPSGAGKDSLIRALPRDADLLIVKRTVTRAADAHEDHHTLDASAFEAQALAGRFALTWRAHGLSYGVPAEVDAALDEGKTVVCNLSRGAVDAARRRWPNVFAVLVTASPETLAARLAARGREAGADQRARLTREMDFRPDATIFNDGALAAAADRFYALLRERRAA